MDAYQKHLKQRRDKDTIHAICTGVLSFGLASLIGYFGLKMMDYKSKDDSSWFYNKPAITRQVYRSNNARYVGIDLNLNGTIEAGEWLKSQPKSYYEPND